MKHKNAKIKHLSPRGWYIHLGNDEYLSKDGRVIHWHNGECSIRKTDPLIMHETREQAQSTLDKYNKEPTLSEIKEKLSAAKELIGKKIKILDGVSKGMIGKVLSIELFMPEIDMDKGPPPGELGQKFLNDNGYIIYLEMEHLYCVYDSGVFEIVPSISVKNHSGEEYFGEQYDKHWQFGCAMISKKLIEDSLTLMQTTYIDNNRTIGKITIGAADFDLGTLKKLVDADNNKG